MSKQIARMKHSGIRATLNTTATIINPLLVPTLRVAMHNDASVHLNMGYHEGAWEPEKSGHSNYGLLWSDTNILEVMIMSDCCSNSCSASETHNKHRCPVNGREYKGVSEKTILHHIKESWHWKGGKQSYFFCDDPECDVVYFGQDDSVIEKSKIRTSVGVKEPSGKALVCYCFGVTVNEATAHPEAKAFVIEKTKGRVCECEARNPSGKCCLKDFPKS